MMIATEVDQDEISTGISLCLAPQKQASTGLMWILDQGRATQSSTTSSALLATSNEVLILKPHEGVSTALKLYDESWSNHKKGKGTKSSASKAKGKSFVFDHPTTLTLTVAPKAVRMEVRCTRDEQKERAWSLFEDPWKIKKRLTVSDLGNMSRLLLHTNLVKNHGLPFLGIDLIQEVEGNGMLVTVCDQDSESKHQLVFKKWRTWKNYVFVGMWNQDFVIRRGMKQGDVIGFYWDSYKSRFSFSVLEQAKVRQLAL